MNIANLVPGVSFAKLAAAAIGLAAVIGFAWSWHSRGQQIDTLEAQLDPIVIAATNAAVKPDEKGHRKPLKPEEVPAAIHALSNSLSSAGEALQAISEGALSARAASDAADRALGRTIDAMQDRSAGVDPDGWDPWGDEQ